MAGLLPLGLFRPVACCCAPAENQAAGAVRPCAGGGVPARCRSCRGGRVIGTGAGLLLSGGLRPAAGGRALVALLLSAGRGTGGSGGGAASGAGVALLVAAAGAGVVAVHAWPLVVAGGLAGGRMRPGESAKRC